MSFLNSASFVIAIISMIIVINAAVSMNNSLKTKNSNLFKNSIIILIIGHIFSAIFSVVLLTIYNSKTMPSILSIIYYFIDTFFPLIMIFIASVGIYGISKDIKNSNLKD